MRRRSFLQLGLAALSFGPGCSHGAEAAPAPLRRITLSHPDPGFGGFSAIHVAPNGRDCLVMSDRGLMVALRLDRDGEGRLTGAKVLSLTPMRDLKGRPLRPRNHDSEGLAVAEDGRFYVSFEGAEGGRIWSYASAGAQAEAMPFSRSFASLPPNGGLEALAIDRQGRLLSMPEDAPGPDNPLYRLEAEGWRQIGRLPKEAGFKPVSLDCGPDGALYLLERHFRFPSFRSQLSRLPLIADAPMLDREVLWQSRFDQFGNLEGLSVTRASGGGLRATMVSDNNQIILLSNKLIEVYLP